MATLPKTNKKKPEESIEDPLDTINQHLYPPSEDPPIITVDEEPNLPEEELYFTSDLGEQVYPVAKDPKKNYPGIDVGFNQPPIYASPKEMDKWSPEMMDLYYQLLAEESNEPMEKTESPLSVYPYETTPLEVLNRPEQEAIVQTHSPEYGPDGKLPPGLTTEDLKKGLEDPLDTINRYRAEQDYWNQPVIPMMKGVLKEIDNWGTGIKFARIAYGAMADVVDWPYDMAMGFMNAALTKSGLDKYVGTFKVNNFRNFFHSIGYTFDEETEGHIQIEEPVLYYMADFVGTSWAIIPIQTFTALKNAGALSSEFFSESAAKLAKRTYLGKKVDLPSLSNKIRNKLPFLKPVSEYRPTMKSSFDAIKTSIGEIGQTTVQKPFFTTYMDTVGSAGAGLGFALGKEFSDSPTVQLFTSLLGGFSFTSHLTLLKKGGALTSAGIQKLGGTFGAGATRRAANRLYSLSGDEITENTDAVLRAVLDKEAKANLTEAQKVQYDIITKYIDPDVMSKMTPAQRAAVVGRDEFLPLEKLILTLDARLSPEAKAQLQELQDIMLQSFSLPGENIGFTREVFHIQQDYLKALAAGRMKIAEDRATAKIKAASPDKDEVFIADTIRKEVESALTDIKKQEKQLWDLVSSDTLVNPSPVIDVWKGLLKDRDRMSRPDELLLTGGNNNLLLEELGFYKDGEWVPGNLQKRPDLPEGTLVQKGDYTTDSKVSIQLLQSLRRRLLQEMQEPKTKNNFNKKRILNEVQQAILTLFKHEAHLLKMKKDPETGEFVADIDAQIGHVLTAIEHSAMLNSKFNDDIVGELLGSSATAKEAVPPSLTAEFIFKGSPIAQQHRVKKVLDAVKRESTLAEQKTSKPPSLTETAGMLEDEAVLKPVTDAMRAFIKHQFIKKFVTEDSGKLFIKNPVAAGNWVRLRQKHLLKEFPGTKTQPSLRNELMEAVIANKPGKLYGEGLPIDQIKKINKYLLNKDRQITVLFTEVEPTDIFNWSPKSRLIAKTPVSNTKKVQQIIQQLASNAQKDPTGRAMRGLQESVYEWIIQRSYIKQTEKDTGREINTFSGAKLSALLEEKKTQIIIDTILTKPQQKEKLKVLEFTANLVDSFRVATPLVDKSGKMQTISGDKTGWFLSRVGNVLGAFLGRKLGTGTLQAPTGGARIGEMIAEKAQIDWAERFLIHALMDSDSRHLAVLLQKVDTPAKHKEFDRYLRSFFAYTITEYNLPFPNIDRFGTIDGEEDDEGLEGNVPENETDIILKLEKELP